MITSTANAQIKQIVALQKKPRERKKTGLFVVEGLRAVKEAPPELVEKVYASASFAQSEAGQQLLDGLDFETTTDAVFAHASDTQTPQGIMALVRQPVWDLSELLGKTHSLWLVTEAIQDPGNLGTMLRTGEAAGVTGVILDKETVDLFHPKTVRSTMGSLYRVPFCFVETAAEAVDLLKKSGAQVYAATLDGSVAYDTLSYKESSAFLIGNEGNGLQKETAALADGAVHIPMQGQVESLNAAMAAGVLLFEAARQRRFC